MSGIYINGMEMPTEGGTIVVYKINGQFFAARAGKNELFPLIPAADVVERKRGKWREDIWITTKGYSCSECNGFATNSFNFCPNCGKDMRELPKEVE